MSYKAQAMALDLADELSKRIPSLALAVGADTNGDTTLALGSGTAGQKNVFIRVKALPWNLPKNIVGLDQEVYTPSVIEFATEANYAGTSDNVADILTPTELLPLIGTLTSRGARCDWYVSTNGTAPTVATVNDSTKLKASYDCSLYGGMRASS